MIPEGIFWDGKFLGESIFLAHWLHYIEGEDMWSLMEGVASVFLIFSPGFWP